MMTREPKTNEEYLFKIAREVLYWADYKDYTEEELSNLVMGTLIDIKK